MIGSARRAIIAVVAVSFLHALPQLATAHDDEIRLDVTKHVLANGMRVLIVPWGDAPVVATYLRFNVGGVDDPKGVTGIAHLLEHMMFKGTTSLGTTDYDAEKPVLARLNALWTKRDDARLAGADAKVLADLDAEIAKVHKEHDAFVVKNEIWQIYERCGGTGLNASTDNDSTQYYVTLPANQLEVWARVESDRIAHPVFREFFSERDVVHEERRLRTDSVANGRFSEAFDAIAYLVHPYRQPVVGWSEDIDATDYDEVLHYFKTWYAPNNCVAVLVGDVDPKQVIPLMEKWFGPIAAQPLPRRHITPEPMNTGERRFHLALETNSEITIGWHIPGHGDPDQAALTVATRILNGSGGGFGGGFRGGRGGGGGGGRFREHLVDGSKVAQRVNASASFGRYPGLFQVSGSPARDKTMDELEKGIYAELDRLCSEPPTDVELAKIRRAVASQAVRSLRSPTGIARALADAEGLGGDWHDIEKQRAAVLAVTAQDVVRVVKKYLTPSNRVVGVIDGTRPEEDDSENGSQEGRR